MLHLAIPAVALLAAFAVRNWSRPTINIATLAVTEERIQELRLRVGRDAAAADDAEAAYRPHRTYCIHDLTVAVDDVFRGLPGVANVEVSVRPAKVARRIVHVRDRHFMAEELFTLDLRQAVGRPLSDAEVESLGDPLLELGLDL